MKKAETALGFVVIALAFLIVFAGFLKFVYWWIVPDLLTKVVAEGYLPASLSLSLAMKLSAVFLVELLLIFSCSVAANEKK